MLFLFIPHALACIQKKSLRPADVSPLRPTVCHLPQGFSLLLARTEDLYLDTPNVLELLSYFIARAVVDEVLPPAFVVRVDVCEEDMGFQVVSAAQAVLSQRNQMENLEDWQCWVSTSTRHAAAAASGTT